MTSCAHTALETERRQVFSKGEALRTTIIRLFNDHCNTQARVHFREAGYFQVRSALLVALHVLTARLALSYSEGPHGGSQFPFAYHSAFGISTTKNHTAAVCGCIRLNLLPWGGLQHMAWGRAIPRGPQGLVVVVMRWSQRSSRTVGGWWTRRRCCSRLTSCFRSALSAEISETLQGVGIAWGHQASPDDIDLRRAFGFEITNS